MRYITTFIVIFLSAFVSLAQMSDASVIDFVQKAQAEGKSAKEITVLLSSKGVTQDQLVRIKSQIENNNQKDSLLIQDRSRMEFDTTYYPDRKLLKQKVTDKEKIYGHGLFNNPNLSFEPNINMPTPDNYKLGAGDQIIIDIWGDTEKTIRQAISPEGTIFTEGLGPVYLNGLTIKAANDKVKQMFARIHADLDSDDPRTFIQLSLGQIRSIRVNIIGEATIPGTYTLPSLATVFHALYAAGGVNEVGTVREIKVYRAGKLIQTVDIYHYLMTGDDSVDITLQEGDNIIIDPYKSLTSIKGEVKRPLKYEMLEGETLIDLLKYSGGYSSSAYRENVTLTRRGDTEFQIFTVNREEIPSFTLADGDEVAVGKILDRFENRVQINGAIYRPGDYALSGDLRYLSQLLNIAEGVKGDAFLDRALFYRENPDLSVRVESIDLRALLNEEISDIELQKNDSLHVSSIYEIREGFVVTVHGEVKKPGIYPFIEDMSLEEVVLQSGGLLESASVIRVDVSRRIKDPKSTVESTMEALTYSLSLKDGLIVEGPKDFVLQPFDEVYIRRSPGYAEQQNVTIRGEVMYAGIYSKKINNERLSSLIERAGGVTSKAYVRGARIERQMNEDERRRVESVLGLMSQGEEDSDSVNISMLDIGNTYYVGIELDKALENPGSDYDLVLREGDRLIVPVYSNTVKISGAVMYPNTVTYNSDKRLKDYVSQAGGVANRAKKGKTYIVYMNGTVARSKGWKNKKQLEPGCEVIVPLKPARRGVSLPEIMSLASSTTSIAALVTSIVNSTK